VGGDAHEPARVGDQFADAMQLLSSCNYQQVSFFLDRQRYDVPIKDALDSLAV